MQAFDLLTAWPVNSLSAGVVDVSGAHVAGPGVDTAMALASVTKPLTALACLVAVEEGLIELDTAIGPPRSTTRHLLSHASGLAPDQRRLMTEPGTRRIYSNSAFEVLADFVGEQAEMTFDDYFHEALAPLELQSTVLRGSPAHGAVSSASDLMRVASAILRPDGRLLDPTTIEEMCAPAFPDLPGILPGYGIQDPNSWGLGIEIRGTKAPHWTGSLNSQRTVGHFGRAGGFMWIDLERGLAAIVLTDREFGDWAVDLWPNFSDAVIDELT
jgi:CubicO group peptidase (beta-lactamase class C family)